MDSFYKLFIKSYFNELKKKRKSYRSIFRADLNRIEKVILCYEWVLEFITSKISKDRVVNFFLYKNNFFLNNIEAFEETFDLLEDERSKKLYIQYVVFKTINSNRFKLNLEFENISKQIKRIEGLQISSNEGYSSNIGYLHLYNLKNLGYDITIINNPIGILIDFVFEQYAYEKLVSVKKDDVVIDCGGATGDTALYFSSKGASKILIVEFIKSNIELIKKQFQNNKKYNDLIEIIEKPLWDKSGVDLSYLEKGSATRVAFNNDYPKKIQSGCIDEIAVDIEVDFIKMDIEGAELPALRGAAKTIKTNKPKLAICVYHKENDLIEIPKYIQSLNKDYKFFFDYYTDIGWEAVLFAIDKKDLI